MPFSSPEKPSQPQPDSGDQESEEPQDGNPKEKTSNPEGENEDKPFNGSDVSITQNMESVKEALEESSPKTLEKLNEKEQEAGKSEEAGDSES